MQNETLQEVILNAKMYAMDKKHTELAPHHVLYSLVVTESDVQPILLEYGFTAKNLDIDERGRGGVLVESDEYVAMKNMAHFICTTVGDTEINCKHVLLAIICSGKTYASGKIKYVLKDKDDTKVKQLYQRVKKTIPNNELLDKYLESDDGTKMPHLDEKHLTEFEYTAPSYVAD